ncbi:DUF4129 domain-containing protein [Tautonia sp. JC769]|uniref:DUF4129 domain-containing protein n=1 Tax=Tautonia sp. JC769 TaxID=3232135 RepID=UPI00345AB1A9
MVIRRMLGMVVLVLVSGVPWACALGQAQTPSGASADREAVEAVRRAFADRSFPWYDAQNDGFRPVTPPRPPTLPNARAGGGGSWFDWPSLNLQDLGRLIVFVLLAAGLMALILYLARTWQRRIEESGPSRTASKAAQVTGSASRIDALPTGLETDDADPLEAARRFRDRGDRGRAVVLLFVHQLLLLDRMGLIRLAPGRTGRQLVRSIEDRVVQGAVGRTLRMFEAVSYGHQEPDAESFEALWEEAESLEAVLASGVAR